MIFPYPGRRLLGVAVPLTALWSEKSCGVGEFADLIPFASWCHEAGIKLIQILPVNDSGDHSSPYFALSAFALHPIHIRLADLPEAPSIKAEIDNLTREFSGGARVPYHMLLSAKTTALQEAFNRNQEAILGSKELAAFIKANPWLKPYAAFRLLKARNASRGWKEWKALRDPEAKDIAAIWKDGANAAELNFYAWVQLRLEQQFSAAVAALDRLGIALKGDLPILLNEDSADVWAEREIFNSDYTAGSPPDMGSTLGQNWGFPIYDWDALAERDYDFWKARLKQAEKFYHAFRIDHVLGFFRIWAVPERDQSASLGHFIPSRGISASALVAAGFDKPRLRWLSEPHIRLSAIYESLFGMANLENEVGRIIDGALERVGNEDLFLFKRGIRGEKDIYALNIEGRSKDFLVQWWRNRVLISVGDGLYLPSWRYWETQAFPTLNEGEKAIIERIFRENQAASETLWEESGREILALISESSSMLPCAEDLGSIPPAVPRVLAELDILGLRIVRWTRKWNEPGQPFIPLGEYPAASVSTLSVHDCSTLREWWEREADHRDFYYAAGGQGDCPSICDPGVAAFALKRVASGSSRLFIPCLQDILALSDAWKPQDPAEERVNVPGLDDERNWSYRMPGRIEDISKDENLKAAIRQVAAERGQEEAQ